jgi:hypothetical protein
MCYDGGHTNVNPGKRGDRIDRDAEMDRSGRHELLGSTRHARAVSRDRANHDRVPLIAAEFQDQNENHVRSSPVTA